jgi:hypothetical protein
MSHEKVQEAIAKDSAQIDYTAPEPVVQPA